MGQTAQGVLVGFETVPSRDAEGRGFWSWPVAGDQA